MRVLITGIAGFAGSHLAEFCLQQKNTEVWGIDLHNSPRDHIRHLLSRIRLCEMDIRDSISVREAVNQAAPDVVFHLAARTSVAESWESPADTLAVNVMGSLHLLEALHQFRPSAAILLPSSCEVYGDVAPEQLPIGEETPLHPVSPYAVSKIAMEYLGYQYYRSYGTPVVRLRVFHHIGPRQAPQFVTANLARQIAAAEANRRPARIRVGNLKIQRDFTDVRDIVRAYWLAAQRCRPGEVYTVGSGRLTSIERILEILMGYSRIPLTVEVDPTHRRPVDPPALVANSAKFQQATGWMPEIPIEKSLEDILHYWRAQV